MSLQRALHNAVEATRRDMNSAYHYAQQSGEVDDWSEVSLAEDRWHNALRIYNARAQQFGWELIPEE